MLWKCFSLLPNTVDQIRDGLWTTGTGMLLLEKAGLWERDFVSLNCDQNLKYLRFCVRGKGDGLWGHRHISDEELSGQWVLLRADLCCTPHLRGFLTGWGQCPQTTTHLAAWPTGMRGVISQSHQIAHEPPQGRHSLAWTLPSAAGWFNMLFKSFSPSLRSAGGEDLSDCICDPGNSSQAETAESLIFRKIT